jgi:preprotein translocase subunit SecA
MNKQRAYIYNLRKKIISNESLKEEVINLLQDEASTIVNAHTDARSGILLSKEIARLVESITGEKNDLEKNLENKLPQEAIEKIQTIFTKAHEDKEKRIGSDLMRVLERALYVRTIDLLWIDHLDAMDHLREGIGLRGYGQKDPLIEYKNESYSMFRTLLDAIDSEVISLLFRAEIQPETSQETKLTKAAGKATPQEKETKSRENRAVKTENKVGRNDPCPCGSGKKFKKCCGK